MKVWAVANQKGGVGKTTTAVTLAGILASQGKRTLILDFDPHGSLTSYFGMDPDTIETSVYDLFKACAEKRHLDPATLVRETAFENLSIIPASTAIATLDRQLGSVEGMGLVITQALEQLIDQVDHVFMDCPPMLGVLMVNALAACDQLLIPVQTEFLALKGLERMLNTLGMIQRSRPNNVPHLIIPTMFDRRTRASIDALDALRERYGDQLWHSVIPIDTRFREASKVGKPLSSLQPRSRGALAYAALMDNLLICGEPVSDNVNLGNTNQVLAQ